MSIIQQITAHRVGGWLGQYNRMMRWVKRMESLHKLEYQSEMKTHDYYDTLYACFQNIFMLKDWLIEDTELTKSDLNQFVNSNLEIGICRDICNGTKHFNVSNPSVSDNFGIVREFNPLQPTNDEPKLKIIIISDGKKFTPLSLINKNVELWNGFIEDELKLEKK